MVKNVPVRTLTHDGLTIEGYSRAAVQTYWRVPELKLGFDLGAQPWSFMGTETWFVSHGHLDHIAALPVYVARRRMMKMSPPVIYLPEVCLAPMQAILKNFTRLDRGRMPCELRAIEQHAEVELSREHVVTATPTTHTIPSFGFVVWQRKRKLKLEYQGLDGSQIRDIRLAGTEVTEEQRAPLVAYLGDSSPPGLDACPAMYEAKILICEVTFFAPGHRREKIHKFGHIHLDDFVERADRFKNEIVVVSHLSTRYHPRAIEEWVDKALPGRLDGRLQLWL